MPRAKGKPSPAFEQALIRARDDIKGAWDEARVFDHMGLRGSVREGSVRKFLEARLPDSFAVCSGQATDRYGTMTRQLDVMIYDADVNPPLVRGEHTLLPAEALLGVVEIKSRLEIKGVREALDNASSVHALRPNDKSFLPFRRRGTPADDGLPRCFYTLLASESDLSPDNWVGREWKRLVSEDADDRRQFIDMLVVLERGLIKPSERKGKSLADQGTSLQQWFVSLANFLAREARRRPPVDWQTYAGSAGRDWISLDDASMSVESKRPRVRRKANWLGQTRQPRDE